MRRTLSVPMAVTSSLFVSITLLAGCEDADRLTRPADTPPAQVGATIDRTLVLFTVFASGPPADLGLIAALENTESFCAGEDFEASPQRGQLILTPSEKAHLLSFTREGFVEVFDFAGTGGFLGTQFCDLLGAPLLASGRVTLSQIVHDPGGSHGALVAHVTANGVVDLASGGQARLHATAQVVIRPNGSVLDKTSISLEPI